MPASPHVGMGEVVAGAVEALGGEAAARRPRRARSGVRQDEHQYGGERRGEREAARRPSASALNAVGIRAGSLFRGRAVRASSASSISSSMRGHCSGSTCLAARVAANSSRRSSVVASARRRPSARAAASSRSIASVVRSVAACDVGMVGDEHPSVAHEVVGRLALRPASAASRAALDQRSPGASWRVSRGRGDLLHPADDERGQQLVLGLKAPVDAGHPDAGRAGAPRSSAPRARGRRTPHRRRSAAARTWPPGQRAPPTCAAVRRPAGGRASVASRGGMIIPLE